MSVLSAGYIPSPQYIVEGDTPSFLWIIPNGLNEPEHPEYGGWGGRYILRKPLYKEFGVTEWHPIYTNASDTVTGSDNMQHTSPQATIWRWREDFQNEFAARMQWTATNQYQDVSHPPGIKTAQQGNRVTAYAENCITRYFIYPEAGTFSGKCTVDADGNLDFSGGKTGETIHVIAAVTTEQKPSFTRYHRFILQIMIRNSSTSAFPPFSGKCFPYRKALH